MKYLYLFFLLIICGLNAQNHSKYPDLIFDSYYSAVNPKYDSFYGGEGNHYPIKVSLENVLNDNDSWFVSLPKGSYIIYQYTDNGIINAPNQDDIIVIENGCCKLNGKNKNPEKAKVYVSSDGVSFELLGTVDDCRKSTLDLENIKFNEIVRFVKIEGVDYKCYPEGFDLKNAYALPNANVELYTGIKNASSFFSNKKEERIMILENIYFETDSYRINQKGERDLKVVLGYLKEFSDIKIHLTGHTDSDASDEYNMNLSLKRAKAVRDYLISNGIDLSRITYDGKGETMPLKSNATAEGKAINRRVELKRLN